MNATELIELRKLAEVALNTTDYDVYTAVQEDLDLALTASKVIELLDTIEAQANELADALDCKNGKGPTALGMVIAERDALRAKLETQAKQIDEWKAMFDESVDLYALLAESSKNQLTTLQADADRYRWLRDDADSMSVDSPLCYMADLSGCAGDILYGEKLDAAIDAAKGNV